MKNEEPWQGAYGYIKSPVAADVEYGTGDLNPGS